MADGFREDEWDGGGFFYAHALPGKPTEVSAPPATSALHFDHFEELLWSGNETGRVVSYTGPSTGCGIARYTAFVMPGAGPIRALDTVQEGVLVLSPTHVRLQSRTGWHVMTHSTEKMTSLSAMHRMPDAPTTIFLGGEQPDLIHLDFETQRELRTLRLKQTNATVIRSNVTSLLTADSDGNVTVRDSKSLQDIRTLNCHSGPVADFDVQGTMLITCGVSWRPSHSIPDSYVKIYDLRTYRSLPPLPLTFAPFYCRFVPSYADGKVYLASQLGHVQSLELSSRTLGMSYLASPELTGSRFDAAAFSPTLQVCAFGDDLGTIQLHFDRQDAVFNENARESIFADPQTTFSIDDTTHSLASIPLPFTSDETYCSDWPEDLCEYVIRKLKPVSEIDTKTAKSIGFMTCVTNPRKGTPLAHYNICPYELEEPPAETDTTSCSESEVEQLPKVPRFYKPVIVKTSGQRCGEENPVLHKYNRTNRVSLEYNVGAKYANPLVQALYTVPALRNVFLAHICDREHCVPCELGFLFRMLTDKTPVMPACSNNLMRALRGCSFGLAGSMAAADLAQQLIHFIIGETVKHYPPAELSALSSLVDYSLTANARCIRCSHVVSSERTIKVLKIAYPPPTDRAISFCSLLEKSLHLRTTLQAECADCATTTNADEMQRVRALPPVMLIDANPTSAEYGRFWKTQLGHVERRPAFVLPQHGEAEKSEKPCRWGDECRNKLTSCKYVHGQSSDWDAECTAWMQEGRGSWKNYVPPRFYARISGGIAALQPNEPDLSLSDSSPEIVAYKLVAATVVIAENPAHPSWKTTLTECLAEWTTGVPTDSPELGEKKGSEEGGDGETPALTWLLINGIAVSKISQNEALHLDPRWKLPVFFIYVRETSDAMTVLETRVAMPTDVFTKEVCLTGNDALVRERRLLSLPGHGEIVGIDAEFISMSKDGSKKQVGRVSCVDATGERVFMDDYIVKVESDDVHDYLTKFSGIKEEDICPQRSDKHLTTLKIVYMKLLHLISRGCIFVGHALFNDFGMLNIYVPPEQIRDTVKLFRRPNLRMISLQFLAFHLLDTRIQETSHDSVEDARISLRLYRKWQELEADGTLEATLKTLYETGKATNWKTGLGRGGSQGSGAGSIPLDFGGGREGGSSGGGESPRHFDSKESSSQGSQSPARNISPLSKEPTPDEGKD